MQNRRKFLKQLSMVLAGGALAPQVLSSCAGAGSTKHIGLQLYSLREMVKEHGIQKVLEAVSKMGYKHLETAGYNNGKIYGMAPGEYKKLCNDLGLRTTSAHLGRNLSKDRDEDMSWWNKAVEAHNEAGLKYMVMPFSPLGKEDVTMDDVKRYCNYFNEVGLITAGASIQFGYHNHAFEFERKLDGAPLYDAMMKYTSPDHVLFQLDVYWAQKGGFDPVEYMNKYADRIKLLHIKDEKTIGKSGSMNFEGIFNAAYANGVIKDWYVEVERYDTTPEEDVKASYDYLANAAYVK